MADETALVPYQEPVVDVAPALTDKKAQRNYVVYLKRRQLLEALAGVVPVATMVGSVVLLKSLERNDQITGGTATVTATAAVIACMMQAAPPEAWNALGNVGVAAIDKLDLLGLFGF